jgi:toxin HigB-1
VIQGFRCAETELVWRRAHSRKFHNIERVALRKLTMLHAATSLQDLRVPPGNELEALTKDRAGQHSIQVNRQWRVCFVWKEGGAHDVEIVDYH